jgi:hypothetical protein
MAPSHTAPFCHLQFAIGHCGYRLSAIGYRLAEAGREIRRVRAEALTGTKGGLRALYRALETPGTNPLKDAHAALDAAVLAAYGFSAKKDLLAQLLALNQAVAQRTERGKPVTPPGIPANFPTPSILTSDDCIQPTAL